jgi:leader peptidase (prepilin peptidase) / N-methyltransferase
MNTLIPIFVFIFGTIIGSFLNVVIYRFNTGRGIGGRSACMSCNKTLNWHSMIPIISFFFQRGKCAHCDARISFQYPFVEIITGIVFLALWHSFSYLFFFHIWFAVFVIVFYGAIASLLIVISVYDARHLIIPDKLVYSFAALAFISMFLGDGIFQLFAVPHVWNVLAGPILAFPFWAIWFFSKGEMMGLGDAKLMLGIGFLLSLSGGATTLLIAFWLGAIVGIFLLITKGRTFTTKTPLPFAPFLVTALAIVFFFCFNLGTIAFLFG